MCLKFTNRRIELDRYEANIIDIYNVYGAIFYDYHCQFSARAAAALRDCNIKVDWSIKDTTTLNMIAGNAKVNSCSNCSSTMHLSSCCPQLQNTGTNKVANTANYSKSSNFAVKDLDRYDVPTKECRNLRSAITQPDIVDKLIESEVNKGCL
ncbi:Hypothetical predicted protein [Mytilus galloprovincialis]|uniref:Uncharacterized protein n=1 Tax=Mytilus galloprovincialis TaxID=29158 RepID=A0A8B6EFI8_MYTGA|nr:Hypothetical predicted protein [Mytilus galloprovincialis]